MGINHVCVLMSVGEFQTISTLFLLLIYLFISWWGHEVKGAGK